MRYPSGPEEDGANNPVRGDQRGRAPRLMPALWCNDLVRTRVSGPTQSTQALHAAGDSTLCVHAGSVDDAATGAVGTPIYQSSTFLLSEEHYRAVEDGYARDRFIYTRYGNPNQWALQTKLAALEHAQSAVVFSSGMAAISTTVLSLLDPGAHVVSSYDLYGGTYNLFQQELPAMGMSASFVDARDLSAIERAIRPETQLLYFEVLTNPLLKVLDIPKVAAIARKHGIRLVTDATFTTPLGCRPLELGADVVVHSGSKYLNGHSDLIAGVACGPRKLIDPIWGRMLSFGGSLDPHACFLFERGLKTLKIRMSAIQAGAQEVARFLEAHPLVDRVYYPELESHPDHEVAQTVLTRGGGVVTFAVHGGDEAAIQLMRALRIPKEATSLGGVESLVSLPFNTSHAAFTSRRRADMGISPGCVRLSVGIEDADDLISDLDQALAVAGGARGDAT